MLNWLNKTILNSPNAPQLFPQTPIIIPKAKQLLPDDIASKILQLQFRCQAQDDTQKYLKHLILLYTKAIQYYQATGSVKQAIYHKRMARFLNNPATDKIISGQNTKYIHKRQHNERTVITAKMQSKGQAIRLLEEAEKQAQKCKLLVNNSINIQKECLERRLRKRYTNSNSSTRSQNRDEQQHQDLYLQRMLQNEGFYEFSNNSLNNKKSKKIFI